MSDEEIAKYMEATDYQGKIERLRAEVERLTQELAEMKVNFDQLLADDARQCAELASALSEIERLTLERDALLKDRDYYTDTFVRAEAAERKVEKLREALKPFADQLRGNYSSQSDEFPIVCGGGMYDIRFTLTLVDFRRARSALAETEKEDQQ